MVAFSGRRSATGASDIALLIALGVAAVLPVGLGLVALQQHSHHERSEDVIRSISDFSATISGAHVLASELRQLEHRFHVLSETTLVSQLESRRSALDLHIDRLETMPNAGLLKVGSLPRLSQPTTEEHVPPALAKLDALRERLDQLNDAAIGVREQRAANQAALRPLLVGLWSAVALSAAVALLYGALLLRRVGAREAHPGAQPTLANADVTPAIEAARAEERARIGRNLHDELGALLMSLKIALKRSANFSGPARRAVDAQWNVMLERVDAAMRAVSDIAGELRPCVVDQVGFRPATESYVTWFEKISGISCNLRFDGELPPFGGEVADDTFRIIQEALTNVARHAEASRVEIEIGVVDGRITVRMADNGKGIAPEAVLAAQSHGIAGMFERARHFGADLTINGQPGAGTEVTLRLLPLSPP